MAPARRHGLREILDHAHGPLRLARERDNQRLDFSPRFAAVRPADEIHVHANLRQRKMKNLGDLLAHSEGMSRGSPNTDAVGVDLGDRRMRLHRVVVDHREFESIFEDLVGFGEAFFHIAFDKIGSGTDVFFREGVKARRSVCDRFVDVDNSRQFLIVDMNFAQRRFRCAPVERRDGGYRLPGIDGAIDRDDRLVFVLAAADVGLDIGEIFAGEHGDNSGKRLRLACVYSADACMSVRTAQKLSFDHARHNQITGVLRPAGNFVNAIDAVNGGADDGKVARICAQLAPFLIVSWLWFHAPQKNQA